MDDYKIDPRFPMFAEKGRPHILNDSISERKNSEHEFCDWIATLLRKLEPRLPSAINDFFDPQVSSFPIFAHGEKSKDEDLHFLIWRKKDEVLVR
jgi:hypothetical protein